MTLRAAIVAQFGRPRGAFGRLAGWIMATRPSNRARNRWTVGLLALRPGERVLEIGYGPGLAVAQAAAAGAQVVGLDHSAAMLAQARARNRDAIAAGRVTLHCGGLDALSGLGRFDKAFAVNSVQFWPDRAAALAVLKAALREGGTLALTHQPRNAGATAADAHDFADRLAADLAQAGFRAIRQETLALSVPAICVLAEA